MGVVQAPSTQEKGVPGKQATCAKGTLQHSFSKICKNVLFVYLKTADMKNVHPCNHYQNGLCSTLPPLKVQGYMAHH